MRKKISFDYKFNSQNIEAWARDHLVGLFAFNILIISLLLLRSGGYFSPFYTITINTVVFIGLLGSVILLGVRSKVLFLIALLFWTFAAIMRMMGIEVWAERISIYTFQSLLLGLLLLVGGRI